MAKKTQIPPEDLALFYKAIGDVRAIKKEKIRLAKPTRTPLKQKKDTPEIRLNEKDNDLDHVSSEAFISFKQAAVSHKILRKLKKGQYNVDAILDLHGMKVTEAKLNVARFIQQCLQKEIRVALIIHGKGHHSKMPVLKNKLNLWLRHIHEVLAFCSAAPEHGSRGAIYVLIKQTRTYTE